MTESLAPFSCTHTPKIPDPLIELNCSLVISTYQVGKVIILSANQDGLVQLPRNSQEPMGLSKLRQGRPLGDVPIAKQDLCGGLSVVHLPSGQLVGNIRYLTSCEEIYDVKVLPGLRRPGIMGLENPLYRQALATPQYGFWSQPPDEENPGSNPTNLGHPPGS